MNTWLQFIGYLKTPALFTIKNPFLNFPSFSLSENISVKTSIPEIKKNLMLGKRVECFFKEYLNTSSKYEIVLENLQVFNDKITIGEIDFIIRNKNTNEISHIELTYKFYLYDPNKDSDEIKNWIGPNRNDSLIEKITKLNKKQFPLLFSDFIEEPIIKTNKKNMKQQVCFQAQLFIPYSYKTHVFAHINAECIQGYYMNYEDFSKNPFTDMLFFLPKKQDWLIEPKHHTEWFPIEHIVPELEESIVKKKSPLIWKKDKNGQVSSLFITWW